VHELCRMRARIPHQVRDGQLAKPGARDGFTSGTSQGAERLADGLAVANLDIEFHVVREGGIEHDAMEQPRELSSVAEQHEVVPEPLDSRRKLHTPAHNYGR
jgi:hypothetical protein